MLEGASGISGRNESAGKVENVPLRAITCHRAPSQDKGRWKSASVVGHDPGYDDYKGVEQ